MKTYAVSTDKDYLEEKAKKLESQGYETKIVKLKGERATLRENGSYELKVKKRWKNG